MNKNMLASVKNMLKDGPVKVSEVKKALKVKAKLDAFTQELMDAGFYVKKQGRAWMVTGISICVTYEEEDGLVTCSSNAIAIEPEPEDLNGLEEDELTRAVKKINELIDASEDLVKSVKIKDLSKHKDIREALEITPLTHVETARGIINERFAGTFRIFQDGPRQVWKVCRETVIQETVPELIKNFPGEYDLNKLRDVLWNVSIEMDEPEIRTAIHNLLDENKIFIFKNYTFEPWTTTELEQKVWETVVEQDGIDVGDIETAMLGEDADKWTVSELDAVRDAIGRLYAKDLVKCECFNPVGDCNDFTGPVTLTNRGREYLASSTLDIQDAQDAQDAQETEAKTEATSKTHPKTKKLQLAIRACRVNSNDKSEFVSVAAVLNKLKCRNRAWDDWISRSVNNNALELAYDPTLGENHESRYRDYKIRY